MEVHFLGTSGGVPTPERSLPCTALVHGGRSTLLDCGEGCQRQLMLSPLSVMSVDNILISHHHGDHVTGIPGMLQTMDLFSRDRPLNIYGPPGTVSLIRGMISLYDGAPSYEVSIRDVLPWEAFPIWGMEVTPVPTRHSVPSMGFVIREGQRPGRFEPDVAKALGVPEGPMFSRLQAGLSVDLGHVVVEPKEVLGPPREGRSLAYSGDTLPSDDFALASEGVCLMIHEATFPDGLSDKAAQSGHSTATQAAEVAKKANVETLVLTHISPRVEDEVEMERSAMEVLGGRHVVVARDFDSIRVEYPG